MVLLTSANAATPAPFLTVAPLERPDHAASGWRCIPVDDIERPDHSVLPKSTVGCGVRSQPGHCDKREQEAADAEPHESAHRRPPRVDFSHPCQRHGERSVPFRHKHTRGRAARSNACVECWTTRTDAVGLEYLARVTRRTRPGWSRHQALRNAGPMRGVVSREYAAVWSKCWSFTGLTIPASAVKVEDAMGVVPSHPLPAYLYSLPPTPDNPLLVTTSVLCSCASSARQSRVRCRRQPGRSCPRRSSHRGHPACRTALPPAL